MDAHETNLPTDWRQLIPIQHFPISTHLGNATRVESNKAAATVAAKIKKNNKVK